MERIFSTLLPYCRPGPEGQLAAKALEKGSPVPSRPAASPAFQLTSCPGLHARPIPPPSGGRAPPSAASVPSLTFQFNLSQDAIFRALPPCPSSSHRLTSAPHLPSLPVLPLTLSSCPWPVLSLKQLLFPSEEDSGAGPPREGDGVPGGGPPSPTQTQTQEIQEKLLSLEETIKQLEVVAWGEGQSGGEDGARWRDVTH